MRRLMGGQRIEVSLVFLVVLLLIAAATLSAERQRDNTRDELYGSTYSSGARGARALYLWLDDLGYEVHRMQGATLAPAGTGEVLWILSPLFWIPLTDEEVDEVERWVERGGTLIWADSSPESDLFRRFDVRHAWPEEREVRPTFPWFGSGGPYEASFRFRPAPAALPLLATGAGEVGAVRVKHGAGEVWLFATVEPFTNEGLQAMANSDLVEGMLRHLPPGVPMNFDEIHHGFGGSEQQNTLLPTMRREPWGWGLFYAAAAITLWLLLRGRSFGRPLPLPGEHLRREAGEYIESMAWLYQRAGQRAPVLDHYREHFKRTIAERYRLPPLESDEAFVEQLGRHRPDLEQATLLAHLTALRQPPRSDRDLLALARANEGWLDRLSAQ